MPADAGIRFGQYVLLRRIARGGMAEVFLAQQRGLEGFDRRVAVKRILPHLADSADFVKMFLAEAKLAAQLSHPNIVHIYEFGKVEHDYFIAMEYIDGVHSGQLFDPDNGVQLPPTLVARIGADAAAALHHAHELRGGGGKPLGLVHRDVSPANIMISYDGVVKLCDFGIAKAAAVSDQLTNPGQVKGKYAYMSPEQTTAQPLDGRSDVFSLAIVLWELLAGRYIVPRGDAVVAMRAIRDGKIDPLGQVAPQTPAPLVHAIAWALENRRDQRATAAELAQTLEAYIKSAPEIATSMQLAAYVRGRFPRQTAHDAAVGTSAHPGTAAAPGTVAGPTTPPTPDAPASQLIGASRVGEEPSGPGADTGTHIFNRGDLQRQTKQTKPFKPFKPAANDTLRDSQQMILSDYASPEAKPTMSGATLVDAGPGAAFEATVLEPGRTIPDDYDGDETIERSGDLVGLVADAAHGGARKRPPGPNRATLPGPGPSVRPALGPIAGAPLPPGVIPAGSVPPSSVLSPLAMQPAPATGPAQIHATGPRAQPSGPRPAPASSPAALGTAAVRPLTAAQQRRRRLIVAIGGLVGLALVSFLVALAASSSRSSRPPVDAAVAAATPDARAAALAASTPTTPIDAAAPRPTFPDAAAATTAVASAPNETLLEVTTDPPNGTITIGDQKRTSPAKFVLLAGEVNIYAEHDGYAPQHDKVTLIAGDHLDYHLAFARKLPPPSTAHGPGMGKLSMRTTPYAEVYEGDRDLGQTPFSELELTPGVHVLTLKNPLHPALIRKVTIHAGKTTIASYDLP